MKKAFVVILTFIFIVSVTFFFGSEDVVPVSTENVANPKIIIDAGHGGLPNTID